MKESQLPDSELPKANNLHYLGSVPYSLLPEYAAEFDVALIPFKINELTLSVNPLKLLEYFAVGLPVVSTPLPEVLKYGDAVSVAVDAGEAIAAISAILKNDSAESRRNRQQIALKKSWRERASQLGSWIDELVSQKTRS